MNIMQVSIMRCCNHFDDRKDQVKFMRKRNYSSIARVLAVILCVTTILTFSFYGSDAKAVTLGRPVLVSAQKILADDAGKTVPMTDGEFTFKLSFDRCITGSQGNWKSFYDARNDSAGNIQFNLGYKADIPYNEIAVYKMEEVAGSETSRIEYSSQVYYVAIGYDDNGVAIQYYNKINENGPYDQVDASEVKFTNTVKTQPVPVTRYVVTFNSEGGSAVASQTVAAGSTAVKPADPTKAGYKFADWYTAAEGGTAYDFNTKVMSNITLYAHWDKAASADKPFIMLMTLDNGTTMNLSWLRTEGATKYVVYGNHCNTKTDTNTYEKIKTIQSGSTTKYQIKNRVKGDVYKYRVVAYKGTQKLCTSNTTHTAACGSHQGYYNTTKTTVNKTAVTLAAGNTAAVRGKVTAGGGHKLLYKTHCAKVRYKSRNTSIAKVNSNGVITGIAAGTTNVYVFSPNGIRTAVKVTVK